MKCLDIVRVIEDCTLSVVPFVESKSMTLIFDTDIEEKHMLFNRFTKIDRSFSRSAEGSGIGLYLVKSFVEMHGGYIKVTSSENEGVEFCISLPYSFFYLFHFFCKIIWIFIPA
jgi:light-regulated signal transduction histidine kinase (bacteriophytochrome)